MAGARIVIDVEWEFVSGKFVAREDILNEVMDGLTDPGEIDPGEGSYEVTTWEVQEEEQTSYKPPSRKQMIDKLMPALSVFGITDRKKADQFIELYTASGGVLR